MNSTSHTEPSKKSADQGTGLDAAQVLLKEDGQVRNCLTGEVQGTGVRGQMGTVTNYMVGDASLDVEAAVKGPAEDRNKSMDEFRRIFNDRIWLWGKKDGVKSSGGGSTVHFSINVMLGLQAIIAEIKERHGLKRVRMLDVPCGDMVWMSRFLETRDDVDYVGMEIVPELIAAHQKTYANHPWKFMHYDILRDGLKEQFDLIHSRMMLQHLLTKDAMNFLSEFSKSGSRYLLTTTFPHMSRNPELHTGIYGRFRYLNLEAPPVSLTPPLCYFREGPGSNNEHYQALWKLPLQRVQSCASTSHMAFTASQTKIAYYSCGNWSV